MLYISVICDHHQAFKILKYVSTQVIVLLVENGFIADSPVLHNLFQGHNIIKYIRLFIKLSKSVI
jgi:hypothetical protein